MDQAVIEVRRHFDANAWQLAAPAAGSTLLVTWTVVPEPPDAGLPAAIQPVLAEALCALGPCWFAGDPGSGQPVARVRLRRHILAREALIFRADRPQDLLPAFDSGAHDWSMAAQWIAVGASSGGAAHERVVEVLESLLERWELPGDWPADVPAIIQAGVDGDAAGCHCRTREIEDALREALQRSAAAHGVAIRTINQ